MMPDGLRRGLRTKDDLVIQCVGVRFAVTFKEARPPMECVPVNSQTCHVEIAR